MKLYLSGLSCAILLLVSIPGEGQFIKPKHARPGQLPPKVILVELPTETNRIAYLNRKGKGSKAQALQDANNKLRKTIIADFNDNFFYCPVYFFNDSSKDDVTEKKFENVLFDKKIEQVKNIILNKEDTNYFIVYYGAEPVGIEPESAKEDPYNTSYTGSTMSNLYALNYNFQKLPYGFPDRPRYNHFEKNEFIPKYSFESREFEISYTPLANYYSKTLEKYYRPRKK